VADALGHARDLILRTSHVVLVPAVGETQFGDAHAGGIRRGWRLVDAGRDVVGIEEVGRFEEIILDFVGVDVGGRDLVLEGEGKGDE
jgi:hypothetical protein